MKAKLKNYFNLIRLRMFLIVLVAIFIFFIFGANNLVIGVGAVSIAASMFGEDYTADIANTTIVIAVINVLIGILAYIASLNCFLALIFTFIIGFIIYYVFSYDAKPSKSIGFINTYLLLLYSPIAINDMPKRLGALAFSGIVIMILYYSLSKYNFNGVINKETIYIIELIKEEIDLIISDNKINDKNKFINIKLKNIELKIYERMENCKNDLDSVYIKDVIIILLNKINANLSSIRKKESNIIILENMKKMLEDIKLYILNEHSLEKLKHNLKQQYDRLKTENIADDIDKYNYYTLKASIEETIKSIEDKDDIKSIYINERIKLLKVIKENLYGLKNNIKMTSLRFNLAIKASIVISLSVFIVKYFKIFEGQWAIYTISLLLLPYAEQSNKKAKDRVIGTIIGAILFNIINLLINNNSVVMIILLFISLYCILVVVDYRNRCIFITFTAIIGVKLMYPNNEVFILSEYRVLFTLLGSIAISLIMNVFFPYKIMKDTKNTIIKYVELNKNILQELKKENIEEHKINTMLLTHNYLWRRINYNNKELKLDDVERLLSEQNNFITHVSFLFKTSGYMNSNQEFIKLIANNFDEIVNEEDFIEKAKQMFYSLDNDVERLLMIDIYIIYHDLKNINLIGEKLLLSLHDE